MELCRVLFQLVLIEYLHPPLFVIYFSASIGSGEVDILLLQNNDWLQSSICLLPRGQSVVIYWLLLQAIASEGIETCLVLALVRVTLIGKRLFRIVVVRDSLVLLSVLVRLAQQVVLRLLECQVAFSGIQTLVIGFVDHILEFVSDCGSASHLYLLIVWLLLRGQVRFLVLVLRLFASWFDRPGLLSKYFSRVGRLLS